MVDEIIQAISDIQKPGPVSIITAGERRMKAANAVLQLISPRRLWSEVHWSVRWKQQPNIMKDWRREIKIANGLALALNWPIKPYYSQDVGLIDDRVTVYHLTKALQYTTFSAPDCKTELNHLLPSLIDIIWDYAVGQCFYVNAYGSGQHDGIFRIPRATYIFDAGLEDLFKKAPSDHHEKTYIRFLRAAFVWLHGPLNIFRIWPSGPIHQQMYYLNTINLHSSSWSSPYSL